MTPTKIWKGMSLAVDILTQTDLLVLVTAVFMVNLIFLRDELTVAIIKTGYMDSNFQCCDLSIYGTEMVLIVPYSVDMLLELLNRIIP
jgi:hypothetical protein